MTSGGSWRERGATSFGLAFLALASGSSDAMAFVILGTVFTSAMTGNSALIGIAVSQGHLVAALLPLSALLGFLVGAALGTVFSCPGGTDARRMRSLRILFVIELGLLGAFATVWYAAGGPAHRAASYSLVVLSAGAMGIQGVAARQIGAPGINTIVVTSTLLNIVGSVTERGLGRTEDPVPPSDTRRQIAIVIAYGAGAVLAGITAWRAVDGLPGLPLAAVLLAVVCCELAKRPNSSEPARS